MRTKRFGKCKVCGIHLTPDEVCDRCRQKELLQKKKQLKEENRLTNVQRHALSLPWVQIENVNGYTLQLPNDYCIEVSYTMSTAWIWELRRRYSIIKRGRTWTKARAMVFALREAKKMQKLAKNAAFAELLDTSIKKA